MFEGLAIVAAIIAASALFTWLMDIADRPRRRLRDWEMFHRWNREDPQGACELYAICDYCRYHGLRRSA